MPWNCLWGYESPPPACRVSGPLHLISQKEGTPQEHAFRRKSFRKPRPCHWCHQPVQNEGSCCRVCKYVCHTTCENKVQCTAAAAARRGEGVRCAKCPAHAQAQCRRARRLAHAHAKSPHSR